MDEPPSDDEIAAAILRIAMRRAPKTLCPSDAARALVPEGDWRALMDRVREVAHHLAAEKRLRVTQRGAEVDALAARGPIRLALRADAKDD